MAPNLSPSALTSGVVSVCASSPVTLASVFGSHARGTADAESDIDIAVLAEADLPPAERRDLRLALTARFAERLRVPIETIDVVVLQDVPALLQYNVIRSAVPVFLRGQGIRRAFEFDVERRYEDEAPHLDREAELTIDRILAHRP